MRKPQLERYAATALAYARSTIPLDCSVTIIVHREVDDPLPLTNFGLVTSMDITRPEGQDRLERLLVAVKHGLLRR